MRRLACLLPLAMAACVAAETPPDPGVITPPTPPVGACAAPDLQGLIGQPETVLHTMKFAGPVRIIHPGMAVTMDYREDRLNIEIDDKGKISRVTCG